MINNRFCFFPALNHFSDIKAGTDHRIEPRIMAVLCVLVQRSGELVSRDELISDIWNDYGGGNEGLSQAISFLRKMLDDKDKLVIRTIPKKGYQLYGTITPAAMPQPKRNRFISKQSFRTISQAMGLLYVVITAFYFVYSGISKERVKTDKRTQFIADMQTTPVAVYNPAHRKVWSSYEDDKPVRTTSATTKSPKPVICRTTQENRVYSLRPIKIRIKVKV